VVILALDLTRERAMSDLAIAVRIRDGKVFADSREVARAFGKEPKNVVRDVRNLECSDKFRRLNFELREEIQRHKTGATKSQFYEMTRDGFMFLVMGFTGEPAAGAR
jgi:Rha family phage regulatory protein